MIVYERLAWVDPIAVRELVIAGAGVAPPVDCPPPPDGGTPAWLLTVRER